MQGCKSLQEEDSRISVIKKCTQNILIHLLIFQQKKMLHISEVSDIILGTGDPKKNKSKSYL